jgi:hypothetical protein
MRRRFYQRRGPEIGMRVRLVRVDAHAGPDVLFARRGGYHRVPFAPARRDVQEAADPGFARPCQHRLLIFDQTLVFEVAVRIDQHSGVLGRQFQARKHPHGLHDAEAAAG